jgi:hypothetical protein
VAETIMVHGLHDEAGRVVADPSGN